MNTHEPRHQPQTTSTPHHHSVCPWWLGYLLATPLRRLIEHPETLLAPYVRPGMTVLEPGPAMGFFTLPLARLVGEAGTVLCADVQPRMLESLGRRAARKGLRGRLELITSSPTSLGVERWAAQVDLAIVIHMLHEVPDQAAFLRQVYAALRPGGQLLVREPKGHVTPAAFEQSLQRAEAVGFVRDAAPTPPSGLQAVLHKPL